ncbi:hypothetical protein KY289_013679 [Solanum tuberosum]|nr:hypothetical protein KY289_013679 [Solanum tuberosum]
MVYGLHPDHFFDVSDWLVMTMLCQVCTLEDNQDLVEPLAESERFVRYRRRQRRLTYPVPLVASEPETSEERKDQDPLVVMAEMKVRDVAIPRTTNATSSIQKPAPSGSDTYTPTGVNSDYVRLTLFPFSLLGEAKRWLNSEPANYITTWDDLAQKFLIRFFPFGKIAKLRSDILRFRHKGGENLYQAWDRFKSLLLSGPHHHQANEVLVHTFIEGLEPNTKYLLDSAAGGQALEKTYAELFTSLNRISQGNPEWNGGGAKPVVQKTAGVLEMDAVTALSAQIAAMQNMMTTHFSNMSPGQQQAQVNVVHQPQTWCEVCGGGNHRAEVIVTTREHPLVVTSVFDLEEVKYKPHGSFIAYGT